MSIASSTAAGAPDRVLIATAVAHIDPELAERFDDAVRAVVDWESVIDRAREQGVLPILAHVAFERRAALPPEVLDRLAVLGRDVRFYALRLEAEVVAVVRALNGNGVEPLVVKGIAVAKQLYRPAELRLYGDVDLVIDEDEWPRVLTAMEEMTATAHGWRREGLPPRLSPKDMLDHWFAFTSPDGLTIEFSLDALQLGLRMRDARSMQLRSLPLPIAAKARMLSREDQLVQLAVHLNRHGFGRLVWFVDIALLARDPCLDWSLIASIARREGVGTAVRNTLARVFEVLGLRCPDGVERLGSHPIGSLIWRGFWPAGDVGRFAALHEGPLVFRKGHAGVGWRTFLPWAAANLALTGRAGAKLGFLARKVAPPPAFMQARFAVDGERARYPVLWVRRLRRVLPSPLRQGGEALGEEGAEGQARHTFFRSLAWNTVAKVSTRGMQFVVTIVLARLLAPKDFGIMGMAAMLTMFIVMFAEFGFAHALIQKNDMTDDDVTTAQTLSILFGALLTGACIAGAGLIAGVFNTAALQRPVAVASIGILIASFGITPRALLYRKFDFRSIAMADFLSATVYGTVAIVLAALGRGVWSLIFASLTMAAAQTAVLWRRSGCRLHFAVHQESAAALMPFGARVLATNLVDFLRANVDYLIVGRMLGPAALGVYTIAFKLADFPRSRLVTIVTDVAFPTMSSMQDDHEMMKRTYLRALKVGSVFTFPLLLALTLLTPEFVSAVYGPKWLDAIAPLRILLPMGLLLTVAQQGSAVLLAKGEPGRNLGLGGLYALAVAVFAVVGVRSGITGVALGVLAATVAYYLAFQQVVWRYARITPIQTLRAVSRPLIGSVAMLAAVLVYRQLVEFSDSIWGIAWLVGAALVGGAAYGLALLFMPSSARTVGRSAQDAAACCDGDGLEAEQVAT